MLWLCNLVTPPSGLILDLFGGSGTTGCAAKIAGFSSLLIDREKDYIDIAQARQEYWNAGRWRKYSDGLTEKKIAVVPNQISMFE